MPLYMTQSMSSGTLKSTLYYRKQTQPHPTHEETGAFTQAAIQNYAATHNIPISEVIAGNYRSGQGVPTSPNSVEI